MDKQRESERPKVHMYCSLLLLTAGRHHNPHFLAKAPDSVVEREITHRGIAKWWLLRHPHVFLLPRLQQYFRNFDRKQIVRDRETREASWVELLFGEFYRFFFSFLLITTRALTHMCLSFFAPLCVLSWCSPDIVFAVVLSSMSSNLENNFGTYSILQFMIVFTAVWRIWEGVTVFYHMPLLLLLVVLVPLLLVPLAACVLWFVLYLALIIENRVRVVRPRHTLRSTSTGSIHETLSTNFIS